MTVLLGFPGQNFHEMKFLFSGTRFHGLLKRAPEHSSKQGKRSTFCTLLVGERFRGLPARFSLKMIHRIIFRALKAPQSPFTSASAVVVLRISGIRHRDGRRVHRSGDLLV